ncbi:hypothetical protein [Yersinia intermedia]|uniref:hypothetical protein n=1 Tax=Yersinia intermedia TaxID=631 RepID=UPI001F532310|nr:hypothetical protein [Yersinia intermedia]UNK24787.1 hypothetical protein MNQ97_07390 [Yersinia intermedia]
MTAPDIPDATRNGGLGFYLPGGQIPVLLTPGRANMHLNDLLILFLKGVGDSDYREVSRRVLSSVDLETGSLLLAVSADGIRSGAANFYYTLGTASSFPLTVRVKTSVPGGAPTQKANNAYVNDTLLPVTGLPAIIKASDVLGSGLPVTIASYTNMHDGDILYLTYGNTRVIHHVSEEEVGLPLRLVIPTTTLFGQGDCAGLVVRYEICDEVNNWSGWSQAVQVEVRTQSPGELLLAPRVRDAVNGNLDLSTLGLQDVAVFLPSYSDVSVGDIVHLRCFGIVPASTDRGAEVTMLPGKGQSLTVKAADIGFPLQFHIENSWLHMLPLGSLLLSYFVEKADGPNPDSRSLGLTVTGAGVGGLGLPALTVESAVGDMLDPDLVAAPALQVTLPPYPMMGHNDTVAFTCTINAGQVLGDSGSFPVLLEDVRIIESRPPYGALNFSLDKGMLEHEVSDKNLGSIILMYRIIKPGGDVLVSPRQVFRLPAAQSRLPRPEIDPAAVDGKLDLSRYPNGCEVMIKPYQGMARGDSVEYFWQGFGAAGTTEGEIAVTKNMVDKTLNIPISAGVMRASAGHPVKVSYMVDHVDGELSHSEVLQLEVLPVALGLDDLTDFAGNNFNSWKPRLPEFTTEGNANWAFTQRLGKTALDFPTHGNGDNSGNVLTKQFTNLTVGREYSFIASIVRTNNVDPAPNISLSVGVAEEESPNDILICGPEKPEPGNGTIFSGKFRAQYPEYYLKIYNSIATGLGNDFSLLYIQVTDSPVIIFNQENR